MTDTLGSFTAMLRSALGVRIDPGAASFVDMFADDGIMEFPYALPGGTARVVGRSALGAYLAEVGQALAFDRFGGLTVHETTNPSVVVLEFAVSGHGTATGEPYEQRYVSVIETRGGRITRYKDYWNPLAVLRAIRGSGVVAALADGEVSRG